MQPEINQQPQIQPVPQMPPRPKRGRKIILILLVLALFAGVGAGAWWYGQDQVKKAKDAEIVNLQKMVQELRDSSSKAGGNSDDSASEQKGLIISQWGIVAKFTNYDKVDYLIERVSGNDASGNVMAERARLTLNSSTGAQGDCKGLGISIIRYSRVAGNSSSPPKIGSFYYGVDGAPGLCNEDENSSIDGPINTLRNSITSSKFTFESLN